MTLKNTTISAKLILAFSLLSAIALLMGGAIVWSTQSIQEGAETKDHRIALSEAAIDARFSLARQENSLRGYMITRDAYFATRVKEHHQAFNAALATLLELATPDSEFAKAYPAVDAAMTAWQAEIADPVIAAARSTSTYPRALSIFNSGKADEFIEPIEVALDDLRERSRTAIANARIDQTAAISSARTTVVVGLVLIAAAAVVLGLLLSKTIIKPIVAMTRAMRLLASGDKSIVVPAQDHGDEIGQMAAAVQVFKDQAIERDRMAAEAKAARVSQDQARQHQSDLDNSKASDLRAFVELVETSFNTLSAGDLTVRMNQAVAPEFEPIRSKFNESVSRLEEAMSEVVGSVGTINSGLSEITIASNDLAMRTEQQAASIEQTVAALSDVSQAVAETARNTGKASQTAVAALKKAEDGSRIAGSLREAMGVIEGSSRKIEDILAVIDSIAFQTNLLALNAGVEAARAGEAGKGFAVVAQEVRELAQRSARAAKEVKDLIATSRKQVGTGVELVSSSGKSLDEIVAGVSAMADVIATIASSAQEQATSLREVSGAADQMDKITQQNAAMVEQTSAAAHALSNETDQLSVTIGRFGVSRVAERVTASPARTLPAATSGAARASTPIRHAPAPRAASLNTPVPAMRTTGSGGAARKPVEDDWEEF
ncbi:methyl-accepting chemotaxis protein [Fulvimarina sp. 2208YS6-2-32]|uniref:Methyl-accepting chemotaxis protein n=1 Tax=Fulvimarina uroteuthidis TaxID=3098149 RepID=A0ABU5I102_9HYPH|nr:methyl-accepting chemotaxis protein [Fulvimarina sp. 2208YS6-2-32]MDY8108807.1 methyl-accepting chemotaxis protein [Fulvimarina sp. 2208YS6-2-32]